MGIYNPETPGGARLAAAITKYRESIAEIAMLRESTLAKAYQDGGQTPVFTRMVEEYGVGNATIGGQVYDKMSAIVISAGDGLTQGDGVIAAGAARDGALLLDLFAEVG